MSTYFAPPTVVNPEINRDVDEIIAKSQAAAAAMDAAYKDLADRMQALIDRMYSAIDEIADAAGAWHCESCGAYTVEVISVANYSDEMGYETANHCARCLPVGVN
jgi:hypothetical protein